MTTSFTIRDLRKEMDLTGLAMARVLSLKSASNVSDMEKGGSIPQRVALIYEHLSIKDGVRRIDAADLCPAVADARRGCECHHIEDDAISAAVPSAAELDGEQ